MDRVKQKGEKKKKNSPWCLHVSEGGHCWEPVWRRHRGREDHNVRIPTPPKKKSHHIVLCHIVSPRSPPPHSKSHWVSFFALMWPEVERRSTSKCVGPSIIPPCKYLHKETSPLAPAKKRESRPWDCLRSQSHIQL